jgi:hypothetical protein
MASLIRDNGLVSRNNRGAFYGCRDTAKNLVGVALVGHATIVEARTDDAVAAFAQLLPTAIAPASFAENARRSIVSGSTLPLRVKLRA